MFKNWIGKCHNKFAVAEEIGSGKLEMNSRVCKNWSQKLNELSVKITKFGGWVRVKASLRIAYSNKNWDYMNNTSLWLWDADCNHSDCE